MQVIGKLGSPIVDDIWMKITNHEGLYYVFIDAKGELTCTREGTQKQIALAVSSNATLVGVYNNEIALGDLLDDVVAAQRVHFG